ncbi:MAG: hypothetical protein U0800_04875 [Isosphaeraceae bacterium]
MSPMELIDSIRIAAPCPASWDSMKGDDRVRHCTHCDKAVYNFAGMTMGEAASLLHKHQGKLCARLYRRKDGTILDGNCPDGTRRQGRSRARKIAAGAFIAGILTLSGSLLAGRVRPSWNRIPPIPSGPNVSLRDWSDWILYAVGAKQYPRFIVGVIAVPTPPGGWDCGTDIEPGPAPLEGDPVSADSL